MTDRKSLSIRRHDVDWLRTAAIGLLIVYHVVLTFEPWAADIGFPQNEESLLVAWIPMALLNVWRIPILFLVSGMGVWFAMRRRDWKALLIDRTYRIALPLIFGWFLLSPLLAWWLPRIGWDAPYMVNFGHLWFLANIFAYVLWMVSTFHWFKQNPDNAFFRWMQRLLDHPGGLLSVGILLVLEGALVRPVYWSSYVDTLHGWILGAICFFLGFVLVAQGDHFWRAAERSRWSALAIASLLYLMRLLAFELEFEVAAVIAVESWCWMVALIGFGTRYWNRPSSSLAYLSKAVYPVYIVHMPVQFAIAYFLLEQPWNAWTKLLVLTSGTLAISLLLYEVLKRIPGLRVLFGIFHRGTPARG